MHPHSKIYTLNNNHCFPDTSKSWIVSVFQLLIQLFSAISITNWKYAVSKCNCIMCIPKQHPSGYALQKITSSHLILVSHDKYKIWKEVCYSFVLTCITLKVSALCILLSTAFRSRSKFSPKIFPALVISVTIRRPTYAAVHSEDEGFRRRAATWRLYHKPVCPSLSWWLHTCSGELEM